MDLWAGGVWEHVMHGADGTAYPNKSVFREIVKPSRLTYSHGGGKPGDEGTSFLMTISLEAEGEKTRITLRHLFPSREVRDHTVKTYGAIEGGQQTLARLDDYLKRM